jgi:hypothetical protein
MEDGMIRTRDEVRCTNTPLFLKGDVRAVPDRESIATERAKLAYDEARVLASKSKVHVEWIITADGEGLCPVSYAVDRYGNRDALPKIKKGSKSGSSRSSGKSRSVSNRNDSVDAMIRATGWTGPINSMMRKAAREAIAFRAQVREMGKP